MNAMRHLRSMAMALCVVVGIAAIGWMATPALPDPAWLRGLPYRALATQLGTAVHDHDPSLVTWQRRRGVIRWVIDAEFGHYPAGPGDTPVSLRRCAWLGRLRLPGTCRYDLPAGGAPTEIRTSATP